MKYCRRCAADLNGADICPVCGTKVEAREDVIKEQPQSDNSFRPVAQQKEPMNIIKKLVIIGVIVVIIIFAVNIIFFPWEAPPQNVKFSGPLTQHSFQGYPMGVRGNIIGVPEDGQPIDVSRITFAIDGLAIENRQTYNFDDVVDNFNGTTLSHGQSAEFYLLLPDFKDEVITTSHISITYDVYVFYYGEYNDDYEFNVDYLYE